MSEPSEQAKPLPGEPDTWTMRRAVRDSGLCSTREAQDLPLETLRELWLLIHKDEVR